MEQSLKLVQTILEDLGKRDGLLEIRDRLLGGDVEVALGLTAALDYVSAKVLADVLFEVLTSSHDPEPSTLKIVLERLTELWHPGRVTEEIKSCWDLLDEDGRSSVVAGFYQCNRWRDFVELFDWLVEQEMSLRTCHIFSAALATTVDRYSADSLYPALRRSIERLRSFPECERAGNPALQHFLSRVSSL